MAEIIPFRGIRYNPDLVSLDDVTSPPYDVISPEYCVYLHSRHPKNVVRLILGQETPEDTPSDNRFTRAAAYLHEWLAEGTLKQDTKPALYVYDQHYTQRGQMRTVRGFISLVKLHPHEDGVILPHEYTLAKPKSALAQLIRAVGSNFDSVYGLYPDKEHLIDAVLDRAASTKPAIEVMDRDNVRHRLWAIDSDEDIHLISNILSDQPILIADGHHRYETALAYRDEMRAKEGNPQGERPYDYVMMTLVNVYAPDVVVFPTHRMARNLSDETIARFDKELSRLFDVIPTSRERMLADMEARGGRAIGVYRPGECFIIEPKKGADLGVVGSEASASLDLTILHQVILDHILGIDAEKLRQEANVVYTRDEQEAFDLTDKGEFQISFILNPIELETILDMSRVGERMPQKATYFFPKLLSGLILRKIE